MSNSDSASAARIRNRGETEQRIILAAIDLIREKGFDGVGVSAVARRAGVSKVLIYRYFGSFEGLLETVGKELDPASIRGISRLVEDGLAHGRPLDGILRDTVMILRERLREDELSMNLMAWEMARENEVTRAFARSREEAGVELNQKLKPLINDDSDVDVEATFAVVSSAVYYLLLRSRFVSEYNGVDIRSDGGWERIAAVLARLLKNRPTEDPGA